MRATHAFGLASALVFFVACGSADVEGIFSGRECTTNQECGAGRICKVGVCLSTASGGASGSGGSVSSTGGAEESGGQPTGSGGAVASTGGTLGTGGKVGTGGRVGTGGNVGTGGSVVATGGSPATGGSQSTGGAGPDAGSGGSTDGGSPSTGGSVSTGGASTGGSPTTGVYCGDKYCPGGQICCAGADWSQGSVAGTFTCTTGTCDNAEVQIECSAHADCHQGQKCCQLGSGRRVFGCMEKCPAAEIECTGPNVCQGGEVCCETTTTSMMSGGETPVETKCQSTCKGQNASGEYILCHSNDDCPDRLPRCGSSNLLPGFKRCWPGGFGG